MSCEKAATVRWNEDVPVGTAVFVFEEHPTVRSVPGSVIAVRRYELNTLTAVHAHIQLFVQQLRGYYPDMPSDAVVELAQLVMEPPR